MREINKQVLKYFLYWQFRYKWLTLVSLLFLIIGTVLIFNIPPYLYKKIFDLLELGIGIDKQEVAKQAMLFVLILFFVHVIGNIFWRGTDFILSYVKASAMRDIENDAFKNLQKHSFSFFINSFSGELITKVSRLTKAYEKLADILFYKVLFLLTKLIAALFILYFVFPIMAVILIVWSALYFILITALSMWKYKFDVRNAQMDSKVTGVLADTISNIMNTKIFSKSAYEMRRFFNVSYERFLARKKSWYAGVSIDTVQSCLVIIVEIVIIYVSIKLWVSGTITIGTIVLVQFLYLGILQDMWEFGIVIKDLHESLADSEEMIEIINREVDIKDPISPEKIKIGRGEININKINFGYEEKGVLFRNFSMKIKSGKTIGLVGESGSGKTTITRLLLRFADINSGEILIDNQDIRNIRQEDLRSKISYVPQEPILFHRTLRENIVYSNPDAPEEEIIDAAKKANIHNFIISLPNGYDTIVGERGIKLSGGERQRVAIARAILKKVPIIILDESTSSLDSKSERLVQKAIRNLIKGKTTIVIAHRLSTIMMMDTIIVLDKGKIIERGTHEKLLKKKGKYRELWKYQTEIIY